MNAKTEAIRSKDREWLLGMLSVILAIGHIGCGGGGRPGPVTPVTQVASVSVTVMPNQASVPPGEEMQITATVIGDPTDSGVTWALAGCSIFHHLMAHKTCVQPPDCNWCGTISNGESASGIPITYTASASTRPSNETSKIGETSWVTLTATSVANPSAVAVVLINVESN
jgi:hypothetical protein